MIRFTRIVLFALFGSLLILSSCMTAKQTNLLQDARDGDVLANDSIFLRPYRLMINDELYIRINLMAEEQGAFLGILNGGRSSGASSSGNNIGSSIGRMYSTPIEPDGTVEIPTVGTVQVLGLTVDEARRAITDAVQPIMGECVVNLKLYNSYFTVIGEGTAGKHMMNKERMNVYEVLALMGDIKLYGDRTRIKLLRKTNQGTMVKEFSVMNKQIVSSDDFWIYPNDVLYIRPIDGQFWGITTFASIIGLLTTITSIVVLVLRII